MIKVDRILNKVFKDEFGRVNGILALNKPANVTSHDIVDEVRKKLDTRKVGHTGTLDPFATGLLIILVGNYTRLSNELTNQDKDYKTKILFGISTQTLDPEGRVTESSDSKVTKESIEKALSQFSGGYEQFVPLFSSVKVNGKKLRELARNSDSYKILEKDGKMTAVFTTGDTDTEVAIPSRKVKISDLKVGEVSQVSSEEFSFYKGKELTLTIAEVEMTVSKGTYVRQLAWDLGRVLKTPAMLYQLERTRVGKVTLDMATNIDSLSLD